MWGWGIRGGTGSWVKDDDMHGWINVCWIDEAAAAAAGGAQNFHLVFCWKGTESYFGAGRLVG